MSLSTPDLLSFEPTLRVDATELGQTLAFAFASGVHEGAIAAIVEKGALPASSWDPGSFARDVFVKDFAAGCSKLTIDGHRYVLGDGFVARVLSHPPDDRRTVELRREILRELSSSDAMRGDLERAYVAIERVLAQLEATPLGRRLDSIRRRLDILAAIRASFEALAEGFDGATSGLSRLREFAREARETDGYRRLSDLLDYEDNLATIDLRVRLGSDGRVRELSMLALRENEQNPHWSSPLVRLVRRIGSLLRGYRFTEGEVLARAIEAAYDGIERHLVRLVQLHADLEYYLAALAFSDRAAAANLAVSLPDLADPEATPKARSLRGLWNPLLLGNHGPIVACDVTLERPDTTVIVTGPNSGGKTRLLQALALTQILGQAGFFVPAAAATVVRASGLFASLEVPTSADQSEGRLGTELLRIRALFEHLGTFGMVILDELCTGTNPSEGEEIFRLVVSLLGELSPQAFITTHFLELADRLDRERPVDRLGFLQVELDAMQCPTYQFVPGVARTSLAHRTAARLGVTREELLELVSRAKRAHGQAPKA